MKPASPLDLTRDLPNLNGVLDTPSLFAEKPALPTDEAVLASCADSAARSMRARRLAGLREVRPALRRPRAVVHLDCTAVYADDLLAPWYEQLLASTGPLELFDAHTHIGVNDPDTFKCTAQELLAALEPTGSRAVVFPMHEPAGYPPANDHVLAAAAASDGRLVAFCRVNPREDPVAEVRRCIAAGARGIKLHPRAEQFDLDEPGVRAIVAEAHEQRLPVLVHAGRGIPALGAHVLELAAQFPQARFI
ncbi:MAG: uncharacterized protein QOJ35_3951, partial [Solirubrobacteraceae bacterium]|nr:uncharacterized protein [Solirubrobacteraceae bacterium]